MSHVVRTSELAKTGGRNTFSETSELAKTGGRNTFSETSELAKTGGRNTFSCGCITCGDEALPMRVRQVDPDRGLALCEGPEGGRSSVETALVEPVEIGDVLLVHAGTAIAHGATR